MHEIIVSPPPSLPSTTPPNMATYSPLSKEMEQILPTMVDTHPSHPLNSRTKWKLCGALTTPASSLGIKLSNAQCAAS
jgi:hypothetical protein